MDKRPVPSDRFDRLTVQGVEYRRLTGLAPTGWQFMDGGVWYGCEDQNHLLNHILDLTAGFKEN